MRERPFFHVIDGSEHDYQNILEMLGMRKGKLFTNTKAIETAYKKVHFDLYNYRTAVIDGTNLSNAQGVRLLKKIIENRDRKGVRYDRRTLRSLKETLADHGVPKFILGRLKWEKGKAKTTFAPGKLRFVPRKTI